MYVRSDTSSSSPSESTDSSTTTTSSESFDDVNSVQSLPDLQCRTVIRSWEPSNGTAFSWPEMRKIGREILKQGTTWLRIHYRMLPGNRVASAWAKDTEKWWTEDGTLYERKKESRKGPGELFVAYEDGNELKHEHLDVTMDCVVIRLEELGVGLLDDTDMVETRKQS